MSSTFSSSWVRSMAKKRADSLSIGKIIVHNGVNVRVVNKQRDGDIYVITLDNGETIRRPPGAKLELA